LPGSPERFSFSSTPYSAAAESVMPGSKTKKARRSESKRLDGDDMEIFYQTQAIALNPRNFEALLRALGAQAVRKNGLIQVVLSPNQYPFFAPRTSIVNHVVHERTYVMDGTHIPINKRRCHDIFSGLALPDEFEAFWCDYGNAHCVLDGSREIKVHALKGGKPNPRTIQLTRSLCKYREFNDGAEQQSYKPVLKCFYYVLLAKNKKTKSQRYALGLNKHIYMLCNQDVDKRHEPLEGSTVWLARYFVKSENGTFHASLNPYVSGFPRPKSSEGFSSFNEGGFY